MYGSGIYGTGLYGAPDGGAPLGPVTETIYDGFDLTTGIPLFIVSMRINDTLTVTADALASIYAIRITEIVNLADTGTGNGRYLRSLVENIQITDRTARILYALATESLVFTDVTSATVYRIIALIDGLRLTDTPRSSMSAMIHEVLVATVLMRRVYDGTVNDALSVTALAEASVGWLALIDEALGVTDSAVGRAVVTIVLEDGVEFTGESLSTVSFFAMVEDGIDISIALSQDGLQYVARTMNVTNKGVTDYSNYPFNSFAVINQRLYGALDDGLYLLEGDTDAGTPIDAYARTALSRIADGKMAQTEAAYIGYSATGQMQLKTVTADSTTGAKIARVYELNMRIVDNSHTGRIKLDKGVKAVYWAFEIGNVLGADFTIDVLEMHVLSMSRRI